MPNTFWICASLGAWLCDTTVPVPACNLPCFSRTGTGEQELQNKSQLRTEFHTSIQTPVFIWHTSFIHLQCQQSYFTSWPGRILTVTLWCNFKWDGRFPYGFAVCVLCVCAPAGLGLSQGGQWGEMASACNPCREKAHRSSTDLGNNKDRDINGFFSLSVAARDMFKKR